MVVPQNAVNELSAALSFFKTHPDAVKLKKTKAIRVNRKYPLAAEQPALKESSPFFLTVQGEPLYLASADRYMMSDGGVVFTSLDAKVSAYRVPARFVSSEEVLGYPVYDADGAIQFLERGVAQASFDTIQEQYVFFSTSYFQFKTTSDKGSLPIYGYCDKKVIDQGAFGSVKMFITIDANGNRVEESNAMEWCIKQQPYINASKNTVQKEWNMWKSFYPESAAKAKWFAENGSQKAAMRIPYLGKSLASMICATDLLDVRLARSIQILELLDSLHRGENNIAHRSYFHGDVKPANVVVDEKGRISFVDFACSETDGTLLFKKRKGGTPHYWPVDICYYETYNFLVLDSKTLAAKLEKHVGDKVTVAFAEEVATYRSIYHPLLCDTTYGRSKKNLPFVRFSIFDSQSFAQLPAEIQALLDTREMASFQSKLKGSIFLASALAYYQLYHKSLSSDALIELHADPIKQDRILHYYHYVQEGRTAVDEVVTTWITEHRMAVISSLSPEEKNQAIIKINEHIKCYQKRLNNRSDLLAATIELTNHKKAHLKSMALIIQATNLTPTEKLIQIEALFFKGYDVLAAAQNVFAFSVLFKSGMSDGETFVTAIEKSLGFHQTTQHESRYMQMLYTPPCQVEKADAIDALVGYVHKKISGLSSAVPSEPSSSSSAEDSKNFPRAGR